MRRERESDVLCAMRRYPGVNPLLALDFLYSDRRAAGLGALDERKRRARSQESRVKRLEPFHAEGPHVVYELSSYRPRRYQRLPGPLPSPRYIAAAQQSTEKVELIEESEFCIRRVVGIRELQEDRARIADFLWRARRELREARARAR